MDETIKIRLHKNSQIRYKLTIFDWPGNVDVVVKQLTEEEVVIGNVQRLIELRDDLSRSDISKLLFELCCK